MLRILKAEFTMLLGELKNYYLNYIFYNLSMVILFIGIFYNNYSNSSHIETLTMLFTAVLWQICTSSLNYLCNLIQDESMMGTLEQMFLCKTNFFKIIFIKMLVNQVFDIIKGFVLFIICSLITNNFFLLKYISFSDIILILAVFILSSFVFCIMGCLFGGLSLYFKRVSSVLNVFSYFLLMFTGIFSSNIFNYKGLGVISRIIPLTNSNLLIKDILLNNFDANNILYFIVTSCLFSLCSLIIFFVMLSKAKKEGKLGQY